MSIVLYGERWWHSPFVFSVFVALHEKGMEFTSKILDLDAGEQRDPGYAQSTLTGRVPAIIHDGFWLSESQAILDYLDEAFPETTPLLPRDLRDRARARQILAWLRSDLGPLREARSTDTMFYAMPRAPLSGPARAAADKLLRVAGALIPEDGGDLFGAFSIADADLAFALHRLILNGDPVPERVRAWAERVWARPSVQAYVQQDRPKSTPPA